MGGCGGDKVCAVYHAAGSLWGGGSRGGQLGRQQGGQQEGRAGGNEVGGQSVSSVGRATSLQYNR